MSIALVIILLLLVLYLVSQFGGKLSAKNALIWWLIFAFLLLVTIYPNGLLPIAHALGIQLVSNFVLAGMILFLSFQSLQESTVSTVQGRKIRELVTQFAAEKFLTQYNEKKKPTKTLVRVLMVFPCYNEEANLPSLIDEIKKFTTKGIEWIPCIVNDGSRDQSEMILESLAPDQYAQHMSNVGVAGVLLTGFKIAAKINADFVIQCDADGQHPLSLIPELISEAVKNGADLVIGSRYLDLHFVQKHESSTLSRRLGSHLIRLTLKLFSLGESISDPTSGFRAYSKEAVKTLLKEMPDEYPEPESIAILLEEGKKVIETPVTMNTRNGGISSLSGVNSIQFMMKVVSALIGLRLRTWTRN